MPPSFRGSIVSEGYLIKQSLLRQARVVVHNKVERGAGLVQKRTLNNRIVVRERLGDFVGRSASRGLRSGP